MIFRSFPTRAAQARRALAACLAAAVLLLTAAPSRGATLVVQGNVLQGATGVDVGGTLYDVTFVDGTCPQRFRGCDQTSDFTFQTEAAARLAGHALLSQVFVDGPAGNFDTIPERTAGCVGGFGSCLVLIPYRIFMAGPPPLFSAVWTENFVTEGGDKVFAALGPPGTEDTGGITSKVFAWFDPSAPATPEPATWAMMILGFGMIGSALRRSRRRALAAAA